MNIEIGYNVFKSIDDTLVFYGYTRKEYNKGIRYGGNIYSFLNISGKVEEDFTEEDIKYIKSTNLNNYSYKYIYEKIDRNTRAKIIRRLKKGWDPETISADLLLEHKLTKEYIMLYKAMNNKPDQGYKFCIGCMKEVKEDKFWKRGHKLSSRCNDCLNTQRYEKADKDPIYRAKLLEGKRKSFHKNKKSYSSYSEERIKSISEAKKRSYKRKTTKRYKDTLDKLRLLNSYYCKKCERQSIEPFNNPDGYCDKCLDN